MGAATLGRTTWTTTTAIATGALGAGFASTGPDTPPKLNQSGRRIRDRNRSGATCRRRNHHPAGRERRVQPHGNPDPVDEDRWQERTTGGALGGRCERAETDRMARPAGAGVQRRRGGVHSAGDRKLTGAAGKTAASGAPAASPTPALQRDANPAERIGGSARAQNGAHVAPARTASSTNCSTDPVGEGQAPIDRPAAHSPGHESACAGSGRSRADRPPDAEDDLDHNPAHDTREDPKSVDIAT